MSRSDKQIDAEVLAELRKLAQEMLDDGDTHIEYYGRKLADLLRLLDGDS